MCRAGQLVKPYQWNQEQEQEKFENLPENLQATEKNQLIEQAAENLEDAESDISDLIEKLNEIIEN